MVQVPSRGAARCTWLRPALTAAPAGSVRWAQALEDGLAVRAENRRLRGQLVGLREHVHAGVAERDRLNDAAQASQSVTAPPFACPPRGTPPGGSGSRCDAPAS